MSFWAYRKHRAFRGLTSASRNPEWAERSSSKLRGERPPRAFGYDLKETEKMSPPTTVSYYVSLESIQIQTQTLFLLRKIGV